MNTSCAWSSLDGGLALSSPDTLSLTLSEADGLAASCGAPASPGCGAPGDGNHLVSRQAVLSRIGLAAVATASHISSRYSTLLEKVHTVHTLLEKVWPILLCLTDDAVSKLYVTQSFIK